MESMPAGRQGLVLQNVFLDLADDVGNEASVIIIRQSILRINESGGVDKKE